ncbi:hypothetical protein MKX01_012523 [Papaver californicum]|nr:hypothetical protein MKX01_012523 [Papaver californicum]
MGSGRLTKKGNKTGNPRRPLYFKEASAAVKDNRFVYPLKYRGSAYTVSNYSILGTLVDLWSVFSEDEKSFVQENCNRPFNGHSTKTKLVFGHILFSNESADSCRT